MCERLCGGKVLVEGHMRLSMIVLGGYSVNWSVSLLSFNCLMAF